MSRWRYLALEKPSRNSRFRWRDRILCSLGLALGVFFLLLGWGFLVPAERLVNTRILGELPDRVRISKRSVSVGPLAFGGAIEESVLGEIEQMPQVEAVYRQAHFPDPCQLAARYRDESLLTDLVLEMVDEEQVAHELAPGYSFVDPGPGHPIPAVMPRAILDIVNSGIAVNTNLPQLTESALIGRGFDLYIGTSSFRRGNYTTVRCVLVGVSDEIGTGGPAIPYEAGLRLAKSRPHLHALTLKLHDPKQTQAVIERISQLGLSAPRQELASKISSVATVLKWFGSLLPLAVLAVTSVSLGAVLELQISKERQLIALYRALGAGQQQIANLYLVRAVSVAAVSFILGTVAAWMVGLAGAKFLVAKLPLSVFAGQTLFAPPLSAHVLAGGFAFALTLLAGWYPARRASLADPAEVFREPG